MNVKDAEKKIAEIIGLRKEGDHENAAVKAKAYAEECKSAGDLLLARTFLFEASKASIDSLDAQGAKDCLFQVQQLDKEIVDKHKDHGE